MYILIGCTLFLVHLLLRYGLASTEDVRRAKWSGLNTITCICIHHKLLHHKILNQLSQFVSRNLIYFFLESPLVQYLFLESLWSHFFSWGHPKLLSFLCVWFSPHPQMINGLSLSCYKYFIKHQSCYRFFISLLITSPLILFAPVFPTCCAYSTWICVTCLLRTV